MDLPVVTGADVCDCHAYYKKIVRDAGGEMKLGR